MDKYEEIARQVLESTCGTDEIFEDYDMDLAEMGLIDSFAMLNILVELELATGKRLQPTDISKDDIKTVNNLIAFLRRIDDPDK